MGRLIIIRETSQMFCRIRPGRAPDRPCRAPWRNRTKTLTRWTRCRAMRTARCEICFPMCTWVEFRSVDFEQNNNNKLNWAKERNSSSTFWSLFCDACGIMMDASISLSIAWNRLPNVNTVVRLRIAGFDENKRVEHGKQQNNRELRNHIVQVKGNL